ncbi:MAG: helix-turn-helix transcriptional regulator [Candidatus Helarchaeota archaeon]
MIKRVREFSSTALLGLKREFLENFESEILRGISTLAVLAIINQYGNQGTYGYQILKDLEEKTESMLIIEDGTLYPILKKLDREGIVESYKQSVSGRERRYYRLTTEGWRIYNHMQGFFTKLVESISGLLGSFGIILRERYFYCPNCMNRIDLSDEPRFCESCGLNIERQVKELKK